MSVSPRRHVSLNASGSYYGNFPKTRGRLTGYPWGDIPVKGAGFSPGSPDNKEITHNQILHKTFQTRYLTIEDDAGFSPRSPNSNKK